MQAEGRRVTVRLPAIAPDTAAAIRRWTRGDPRRAVRIDYFPYSPAGRQWAAVGIERGGRCVVSTCSGRTLGAALARFARVVGKSTPIK